MVNTLFTILMWVLACFVLSMFLGWCFAKRRVRYSDWAREERRKILMNSVQVVREEKGDYVGATRPKSKSGVPKSKAAARRPARRVVRRG